MRGTAVAVGLVILAGLITLPPGSPLWIDYVASDSMEPTIGVGDGVVVTSVGGVDRGDVVVFWAPQRSEYVTHRVVEVTDRGYVTKGDNNPSTDQAGGLSHVQDSQVAGEVVTVGGAVVTIPKLGVVVRFVQNNRLVGVLAVSAVLFLLDSGTDRSPTFRSVTRARDVFLPLFLVALLVGTGVVVWGGHSHKSDFLATDPAVAGPNDIPVGESRNVTYLVERSNPGFMRTVVSTRGMTVVDRSRNATTLTVNATVPPPTETGYHTVEVVVYHYPLPIPRSLARFLHGVNPVLASFVSVVLTMVPVFLLYLLLIDGKKPIPPSPNSIARKLL